MLARCVIASGLGLELQLDEACRRAELTPDRFLFSESNGRFLVSVRAADAERLEACFDGLPLEPVGRVTNEARLRLAIDGGSYAWDSAELSRAYKETLTDA